MAIAGLGTDIVEFSRFEKGDGANEGLARRVLTASEWAIFAESKVKHKNFAKLNSNALCPSNIYIFLDLIS